MPTMPTRRAAVMLSIAASALAAPATLDAQAFRPQDRSLERREDPRAAVARKLFKRVTIDLDEAPLRDVVGFIEDFADVQLDPMWTDTRFGEGLDPEQLVTLSVKDVSVLSLLERTLEKAQVTPFDDNTWQFADEGIVEIGPKSRLNRKAALKIYDINDLVFEILSAPPPPQLDLNNVLNQAQSGGGSSSITRDDQQDPLEQLPLAERVEAVIDLIRGAVEFEQWQINGGEGASVSTYQGYLLIRAPDYIHRQISGYDFWPTAR